MTTLDLTTPFDTVGGFPSFRIFFAARGRRFL